MDITISGIQDIGLGRRTQMRIGFRPAMMERGILRVIGMEAMDGSNTIIVGIMVTNVISITTGTTITTRTIITTGTIIAIITSTDRH